jgi:WD40 repeat protein
MAVTGGGALTVWDSSKRKNIVMEEGVSSYLAGVEFSRDGKMLAGGFREYFVHVWDTSSGKILTTFKRDKAVFSCVAISPDGKTLAAGYSFDRNPRKEAEIVLVDLKTGKEITTLKGHAGAPLFCVAFSPDGKLLASAGYDKAIIIWGQGDPKKPAK